MSFYEIINNLNKSTRTEQKIFDMKCEARFKMLWRYIGEEFTNKFADEIPKKEVPNDTSPLVPTAKSEISYIVDESQVSNIDFDNFPSTPTGKFAQLSESTNDFHEKWMQELNTINRSMSTPSKLLLPTFGFLNNTDDDNLSYMMTDSDDEDMFFFDDEKENSIRIRQEIYGKKIPSWANSSNVLAQLKEQEMKANDFKGLFKSMKRRCELNEVFRM